MKKNLNVLILVCVSLLSFTKIYAFENAQERAIDKLITVRNLDASQIPDICSKNICPSEYPDEEGLSYQVLGEDNTSLHQKKIKVETYSVMINTIDGYTFHVADYYGQFGHSRVITCLDGALRGLQGIADNGVLMVQSTDVKWHKNYFEHKYPAAKIYSYSYKQIFELK